MENPNFKVTRSSIGRRIKLNGFVVIAAFILLGCNRGKNEANPDGQIKSTAKKDIEAIDSVGDVQKSDVAVNEYPFTIEGYNASIIGKAIFDGNLDSLIIYKNAGASFYQALTDETYTFDALYAAIAFGKFSIVEWLLKQTDRPEVNKVYTEESETLLTLACDLNDLELATRLAELLIQSGANVNGAGPSGGEEIKIPLFNAINRKNVELVKILIQNGADVKVVNSQGVSAKEYAASQGFAEIAGML